MTRDSARIAVALLVAPARAGRSPVLRAAGLFLVVVSLLSWRLYGKEPHPTPRMYPVTWSGYHGACLQEADGASTEVHLMATRGGKRIYSPRYVFWHGQLVYWSDADRSLCFVPLTGEPRWLSIGNRVPDRSPPKGEVYVGSLSACAGGIFFNTWGESGWEKVYLFNVAADTVTPVDGAVDVHGADGYADYAFADARGDLYIQHPGGRVRLGRVRATGDVSWDYAPRNDTFCLMRGQLVTVIRSGKRNRWRLWDLNYHENVALDQGDDRMWLVRMRPFTAGSYAVAADLDGRRKKRTIGWASTPISLPIRIADAETIRLIRRLPLAPIP